LACDPCFVGMAFQGAVGVSFPSFPLPFCVLWSVGSVVEDGVGVQAQCEGAVQGCHLIVFERWGRGQSPRGEVGLWGGAGFLPRGEVLMFSIFVGGAGYLPRGKGLMFQSFVGRAGYLPRGEGLITWGEGHCPRGEVGL